MTAIIEDLRSVHGDEIYKAALWATEPPDVTEARSRAIADWASDDVQISPYAAVDKVEGGYWCEALIWVGET